MNLGLLRGKRSFSLTGSAKMTILAENTKSTAGGSLKVVAATEGSPDQEITIRRLLSSVPDLRGTVAVTLPLNFFQIITVDIPPMPEEAIRRALPYHLAKTLAQPLPEFIFDWQLTRRHSDRLEVTVYLFPASSFQMLRRELALKQLELKYLEPDVFSAFAYLEMTGRLAESEAILCTLIWPEYSSHAIFKGGRVVLVRSIPLNQPQSEFQGGLEHSDNQPETKPTDRTDAREATIGDQNRQESEDAEIPFGDSHQEILANFSLSPREDKDQPEPPKPTSPPPKAPAGNMSVMTDMNWPEYIDNLGLEIIRTRDYYGLILKGSGINQLFVGGGETFLGELGRVTEATMAMTPRPLQEHRALNDCPTPFEPLCLGAGAR